MFFKGSIFYYFLLSHVFSDLHDKKKDKISYKTGEISLNSYFLTALSRAVFKTQPKVYGGDFLQK